MVQAGVDTTNTVVAHLEALIVTGELPAGSKLIEQTLAERLGVGRGPLREAIRTLEGRRIVERTQNAGVRVVNPSIADIEQILLMREALEGLACRQAAENMTLREVNELRACLSDDEQRMKTEGLGAVFRYGTEDNDFHARIAKGSRNRWLEEILCRDLYSLLRICRLRQASVGDRMETARHDHFAIVDLIQKRDPEAAEKAMRTHIRLGRERLIEALRSAPPESQE